MLPYLAPKLKVIVTTKFDMPAGFHQNVVEKFVLNL